MNAARRLTAAKVRLLLDWPLFGHVILHLEPIEDSSCPTAATDGRYLVYNSKFFDSLADKELLFVAGHEVLHCIMEHISRRGNRDKDYFNMAVDYIVNDLLIKHGIGKMPEQGLYDPAYSSDVYTGEQLYELLYKERPPPKLPLDEHLDISAGERGDKKPEGYTVEEQQAIDDALRSALLAGVQAQEAKQPGSTPAGILRMVDRMLGSHINWREMLDHVLRSAIKYDYSYTRVSRRSWSSGLILPGADTMDRVEAVACLDGSASTTTVMISDFLAECRGIMHTFPDFRLIVMTFDTKVYNVQEFTPENADEIDDYEFRGGGGTAPSCCWQYLRDHDIVPHKLLIFTDGEVGSDFGEPDYCDTLFIIHSNPRITAPYGQTTHYEPRTE
jgi:predicted metal-dependent peptidase